MDGTILIADDDKTIRTVLTQAFTRAGCRVHATSSLNTLVRWVNEGRGDLVISDVIMPDGNGLEALPQINKTRPELPVIVISAQNTIMTAIQATEAEAYDYLPKPFDLPDLMKRSARALERKFTHKQDPKVRDNPDELPLIGATPTMQELYRIIARVLNADLPVMILGESGTGKSLIARAIHDFSDRQNAPFVVVGATQLEEIDGLHAALSKAAAGSLLLDEVGVLSPAAQARLVQGLDALGDKVPRLMATTQQELSEDVASGAFRGDLFYRLSAVALTVPPLRNRIDDIPLLAEHFLSKSDQNMGEVKHFSDEAIARMRIYSWPGNVRQLENMVKRLSVTCSEEIISLAEVEAALAGFGQSALRSPVAGNEKLGDSIRAHLQRYFDLHGEVLPPPGLYGRILQELEVPLIDIALDATGGNQAKCADLLGINRNTLRKKITELDIQVSRRRKLM